MAIQQTTARGYLQSVIGEFIAIALVVGESSRVMDGTL